MSKFRAGIRRAPKGPGVQQIAFRKGNSICNLCLNKANLTYDHVPPKCCGNDQAVIARRIYADELIDQQIDARSPNGLKFRTLCKSCNDCVLGAWDEALGEFTKQVEAVVDPSLLLPERITFNIRAGAILRSILGHVLAAKAQDDSVTTDEKIRAYLTGKADLDPAVKVYCWLYPYRPIVISRDFTFVEVEGEGGASPGLASVVKFFPLAFCVLDGRGDLNIERMTTLHQFAGLNAAAHADILVWRGPVIQPGWPERPMGNHLVLGGSSYVNSVTTVADGGASVTAGKRIQAERWEGGDTAVFKNLHAFVEIPEE